VRHQCEWLLDHIEGGTSSEQGVNLPPQWLHFERFMMGECLVRNSAEKFNEFIHDQLFSLDTVLD